MSSRSSKKSSKSKNRSGNASDAGSVKEFVERDADGEQQSPSEPTSAETRPAQSSTAGMASVESPTANPDPPKFSPTSSVYREVVREDAPAVQVAILEPEIAVATPAPGAQEPIPIQDNAQSVDATSGWFSSLFACCVSRK